MSTDIIENDDKILSYLPLTLDNQQKNDISTFLKTNSPKRQIGKNKNRTVDKCTIRPIYMK